MPQNTPKTTARLALDLQFGEDIVVVNKPAGISTHSPDTGKLGMAELVQQELKSRGISKEIFVVHRLDKTTTGVLIFATSEAASQKLFEEFKERKIQKKYLFLTASKPNFTEAETHSRIEKINNSYVSKASERASSNSHTQFQKIKLNAKYQLWQATPTTGKSHQIRLHAKDLGIPILGDQLYGGAPYPHLCLHAAELSSPTFGTWKFDSPIFFERMGLLRDSQLTAILSGFDKRERLYHFLKNPDQCLRLLHQEDPRFRIDQFGEILWIYWYPEINPTSEELLRFEFLAGLLKKKILIRKMQNRGKDPLSQVDFNFEEIPNSWIAFENDFQFELRKNQGLSPGLFLDQKQNRNWVFENSMNKTVLNLFSYTGGFSVAAAKGAAKEVVTVDLSKNFINWSKRNFELNNLSPSDSQLQFFTMDSLRFLEGTIKKNRKFDLIICDPPSFSRNENTVWRIEKDYTKLLDLCWQCLEKNGILYFSTNYEKWTQSQFEEKILGYLGPNAQKLSPMAGVNLDYENPNDEKLLKFVFLRKR